MKYSILYLQILGVMAFLFTLPASTCFAQEQSKISPGEIWPDRDGNHIQAHGGGILKIKNTYYWYGEQRRQGLDTNFRYVSCYASKDLINWEFKGDALKLGGLDTLLGHKWVLERPKVFYNPKTKKFVMYMHIDGKYKRGTTSSTVTNNYTYASVGVAISDKPAGPFKYLKCFRPLGHESRDIGQFVDDDGTAYLIFEDRPAKGFHIAKLSDDYLTVEKDVCLIKAPLEGGAIVHYNGLYYAIGSALTGWRPNPNLYATATSLSGPWSEFKDIAPSETNTYGSQSTLMLKITGSKKTAVIFMGDIWKPKTQWDSRYLWMPLEIGEGKLWLPKPEPWTINLKTGETK
ncbi:family 43 glycosylhydrolase [Pedobacter sp. MC2016-14]|uniref:family 43 glycosylhydrolase n=1 Tax=Pedobacter sp. MC2016-14 TaxID=2897327 RepID=UPI001E4A60FF|nr:family 43 glycosylhydrolase [Pedobacter sp. MC2016-14]MCD0487635.1 family 43 glycosylhydrolase [Pedobacter sp. MC2016-14]